MAINVWQADRAINVWQADRAINVWQADTSFMLRCLPALVISVEFIALFSFAQVGIDRSHTSRCCSVIPFPTGLHACTCFVKMSIDKPAQATILLLMTSNLAYRAQQGNRESEGCPHQQTSACLQ